MTIQQYAFFDVEAAGLNATSKTNPAVAKMVAAWENKNAKRAMQGSGLALMAMSLTACGGSSTPAVTPAATTTTTTTSDLTVSPDTLSFSGTLSAARAYTPGGNDLVNSLQSDDVITGTGAADVMNVTFGNNNDAGARTIAPTMTGVETINFTNVSSDGVTDTLDMSNATGTTNLNVNSLDDNTVIRGLDSVAIALKAFNVSDETTSVAFEFDDTAVAGATTVSVTVDSFAGNELNIGAGATDTADGTGVETLNLTASGSASTIAVLGSTGNTTVNVVATADLTVAAMSATGVTTMNLTGSTANTSINVASNISANEFTYTGSAGNDTLIANSGFAGTDTLNAGAGTADVLSIRATADVAAVGALNASDAAVATGWDTLDMRATSIAGAGAVDFTVDMDHLPGVTAITMSAADDATKNVYTLNDLSAAQAGALTVTHTGTDADTDSEVIVDMKVNGTDTVKLAATVTVDTQVVELNDANNNIENAEITLSGAFNTELDVDVSSFLTSLTVSGGASTKTLTVSNNPASATVDMSGVASNITTTSAGSAQTIKLGAGDDSLTLNAGVKNVELGAGADTLVTTIAGLGTTVATQDTIAGGDGTDTLSFTEIDNITATQFQKVTGFERLSFTDAAATASTISLSLFTGVERISVNDTNDALLSFTNAAASLADLRILDNVGNDSEVSVARLVDGTTDTMTVTITGGATLQDLVLNDEETINIVGTGTGTGTFTDIDSTDLVTLNISGANAIVASDISSTVLATVDASAATGAVTVSGANSVTAITATGNAINGGILTFTGGSGSDIITGGILGDTLTGGLGNDVMNGGAGADTIDADGGTNTVTGGSGADVFILGEGATTITDFAVGAANDDIHLDLSGLEGLSTSDFVNLDDFVSVTAAHTVIYTTITGATDLVNATTDSQVLVLNGASVADTDALEIALETGGAFALTINGTLAAGDGFVALYDDGTNSYAAYVESVGGVADNGLATAGDLIATNFATFTGIADCTTILAAQFADIIA